MNEVEKIKVIDEFMRNYLPLKDDIGMLLKTMPNSELTKDIIINKLKPIATPLFKMYEKPLNDVVSVYTDETAPFLILILEQMIEEVKRTTNYSPELLKFLRENTDTTTCTWIIPYLSVNEPKVE